MWVLLRHPRGILTQANEEKNKPYRMLRLEATRVPEGWSVSGVFCTNELRS